MMEAIFFLGESMSNKEVTKGFFWHVHHEQLMEWSDDIEERINYIEWRKPSHEREIRLRLMTPVVGPLPEELVRATEECIRRREERDKAYEKYLRACGVAKTPLFRLNELRHEYLMSRDEHARASVKLDGVMTKYLPQLQDLHKQEHPDCPWNGYTIFPEQH